MFVCALVLAVGLAAVMGILYSNFDGQMRKELSKEAAYLTYGVEQQGVDYLKNIKDKSARITYIDQDGTVLYHLSDAMHNKWFSQKVYPNILKILLHHISLPSETQFCHCDSSSQKHLLI